ncbi:hypothetical protein ACHAXA_003342 [Cyclostephanos tholiformis]|uniref:Uncharacterized protein n=1 Tax=Cyclostephanos tholiformis TaxID=382380 RepID=A0ABD3RCJ2_9STRA
MANNGRANCGVLSWAILVATLFISRVDYTSSFQILSTAQALLLGAPMATSSSVVSRTSSSSPPTIDNVPAVLLSQASSRIVNGMYEPRDPASIPSGFARSCNRAGGYAPRPIWDGVTNGIAPWFENRDGCYLYYNGNEGHWCIDDMHGAGMYLASPVGSLLLPPTVGWVSLTGRRIGAPRMSFV